ncbi:MAG: hypothetical protein HIU82_02300 [Proteobacteria bacterium]|nr:hypothetical protein [Pseudomonadota bacterium]
MSAVSGERHWVPAGHVDETSPPPRPTPDDWIVRLADDGAPALAGAEEDDEPTRLCDGETVLFAWNEQHGYAVLTFAEDGTWHVDRPMPPHPEGGRMYVAMGRDWETMTDALDNFVRDLRGHEAATGPHRLSYFAWSDVDVPFVFHEATKSFRGPLPVAPNPGAAT